MMLMQEDPVVKLASLLFILGFVAVFVILLAISLL